MAAELLERAKVIDLTTRGRVTGQAHTVQLWFAYHAGANAIYLLAYPGTGQQGTDWYQNAMAAPQVSLSVRGQTLSGQVVPAPESERETIEQRIRDLFIKKYGHATVSYWYGKTARLPLKIEIVATDA